MDLEMLLFYSYIIGLQNYTSKFRILLLTWSIIFNKFNFQFFLYMCGDNKSKKVTKILLTICNVVLGFFHDDTAQSAS